MKDIEIVNVLNRYMSGKDTVDNEILKSSFSDGAVVTFDIDADGIIFPEKIVGKEEIARTMFGDFHNTFSDIKSYYVTGAKEDIKLDSVSSQKWVVTMRERSTGRTRVGFGYYDWVFSGDNEKLVESVHITIKRMISFNDDDDWLGTAQSFLSGYPWASKKEISEIASNSYYLDSVSEFMSV